MYEVVRSAVRRVNRGTRVVSGGLAWTRSSLPRLLKAFKGKRLDAVAVHPYAATPRQTVSLVRYALAQLRKYKRRSTPLLVNEYGWTSTAGTWGSTNPRSVTRYVYEALVGLSKLRIAQILPFEWSTPRGASATARLRAQSLGLPTAVCDTLTHGHQARPGR